MIDLSTVSEYTNIAQNILVSLSAVTTALLAFLGFNKWKKELKITSGYNKAKQILRAVYRTKRAFSTVRHPVIWAYEYPKSMQQPDGGLKDECDYERIAHVYEERWKVMQKAFGELEELVLDAVVEWGPEFEEAIKPMRRCQVELLNCIRDYLQRIKEPHSVSYKTKYEHEAINKSTLSEVGLDSEYDKFTPQIVDAVRVIEGELRKHMK